MAALFPVIDLLHGQVVRALRGQRSTYQPVVSTLCSGSSPVVVAQALCRHCAALESLQPPRLYVADLDALQGGAAQVLVLQSLLQALPGVQVWLDAGFADAQAATQLLHRLGALDAARVLPVFASETLPSAQALAGCSATFGTHMALSLDRRDGQRLDPAGCWDRPQLWPQNLIVMTLERVGTGTGPDLQTLAQVRQQAPRATVIGAGGLRDAADLAAAGRAGASAWLVASALHDGRL